MKVSIVVPYRAGCPHRDAAWDFVRARYSDEFPSWDVVVGQSSDGPYNRAEAILDGARKASGDVLLVADADVWCDPTAAVETARDSGWAVPHLMLHRLSCESTKLVLMGFDWRGLPLSTDNPQDSKPYKGNETGTILAIRRDVLLDVPPDIRFVGWGQEDVAWGLALRTLVGQPWRGSEDLMHLWHPPQPRKSRVVGNDVSLELVRRYRKARGDRAAMRALIEEAR